MITEESRCQLQRSLWQVSDAAWRQWNSQLSRVAIADDGTVPGVARELGLFYSCLYHSMKKPLDFTGQVHYVCVFVCMCVCACVILMRMRTTDGIVTHREGA